MKIPPIVLSILGLLLGAGIYSAAQRLPVPWNSVAVGAMFMSLGVAAFLYGRGDRVIQGVGVVLFVFGLVRIFLRY